MYKKPKEITEDDILIAQDYDKQYAKWFFKWYTMNNNEKLEYKTKYVAEFPNLSKPEMHDYISLRRVFNRYFWKPKFGTSNQKTYKQWFPD